MTDKITNKTISRAIVSSPTIYTGGMAIKLTYKVPIMAFDNVSVLTKKDGSFHLIFSQYTSEGGELEEADVIAAITVPNNAKWQEIRKLIDDSLANAKDREP